MAGDNYLKKKFLSVEYINPIYKRLFYIGVANMQRANNTKGAKRTK